MSLFLRRRGVVAGGVFVPIIATGGQTTEDVINGEVFRWHAFKSVGSSSFVVSSVEGASDPTLDYYVVGGGASGSKNNRTGAGGAAGGTREGSLVATVTSYTITVGGGGAAISGSNTPGQNGGTSSAFGETTGATNQQLNEGVSGNGFTSAAGATRTGFFSRGGGGACANSNGFIGGAGCVWPLITPTAAAALGVGQVSGASVFFGGGGGGGQSGGDGSRSPGGVGGGGAGNAGGSAALAGLANSGGGGGGGSVQAGGNSGAGGTGVVLVRYRIE